MGRRVISLSLPASDPHTARIVAWLQALPDNRDISASLREVIVQALETGPRLSAIEIKLDRLLAGGLALAREPEVGASDLAAGQSIEDLLDFGV